ncbi:MAG: transketolase [Myxococcota bacterium]|jgi:transketolase|nr:transketolase [Myxococcota bacterium]
MTNPSQTIDESCINALRLLAADAIEKAKSGHPGLPMGAAPMAQVLWSRFLNIDPSNPGWPNRDRFVLSAGHGSMLLYGLMHLAGFESVKIEDIKSFRQWGSRTPGHPENRVTAGVEVTTGPLGQGIANAVGLALAERHLATRFNKPGFEVFDHYTYVLMGDGCMMEGISHEACSLAGHLGLGKLIALYDDNHVTIDGPTDLAFSEDVATRFTSYGWHVVTVEDGDRDLGAIAQAIEAAKACSDKPSLIKIHTTIGFGAPTKAGSSETHGSPLGESEIAATRGALRWSHAPFEIPADVRDHMGSIAKRGAQRRGAWEAMVERYRDAHANEAAMLDELLSGELPDGWRDALPKYEPSLKATATRALSGECLNALSEVLTGLIGGSADLTPSNNTRLKSSGSVQRGQLGQCNLHFGVREHAMAAICNGLALHGTGLVPYCATFLSFVDYLRPALRVAAISGAGVIFVMTHDSIAVGEDGPTHQPIEQLASVRAIPEVVVLRPADGNEVAGAYAVAVERRGGPSLLALSRQNLPHLTGTTLEGVARGAYVVSDCQGQPELLLIGTGSELSVCLDAAKTLTIEGQRVRVVSMPSWELFEEQEPAYRESVLPAAATARVAVEAGSSMGWHRYVGDRGEIIAIDRFGASAPSGTCLREFGFSAAHVLEVAKAVLARSAQSR